MEKKSHFAPNPIFAGLISKWTQNRIFWDFHTEKNDHVKELDYQLLENIKNGWTLSTQYGDNINFKTQNVIIVFSNMYPDIQQLSEDKWMILKRNNMMELKHVTHYSNRVKIKKNKKMRIESDDEF